VRRHACPRTSLRVRRHLTRYLRTSGTGAVEIVRQLLQAGALGEIRTVQAARNLDGYHGAYLLRRRLDDEVEFATILLFDTLEQVRAFAGDDYEAAYVPPRARAVLARFDQRSAHYDTLLRP
jgi:predicted dehydrogenase